MTILSIETSTAVCSAALSADGRLVKQYINREGSNHARLLPTYIESLMALVRAEGLHIDAVALSEGPGSYTGLRIGTSTAKGLCYGLNVPLIPVPTLEVLCEAVRENTEYRVQSTDLLCPMIDARRMEVYAALFNGERLAVSGERARAVVVENEESLLNVQSDNVQSTKEYYYFGDGAEKCQKVLTKPNWHFVPNIVPEARFVGAIVEREKLKVERITGNALAYYEPYYLKEFVAAQSHVKGLK